MFGYIRAYKPEMRVKEFEMYKAIYCSLCKKLGKDYGVLSRFTLSYDFAFLSLLELSLKDGACSLERKRCAFNPLKKCNYCENLSDGFDFSSAVAMIMLYYKLSDNVEDEKGVKRFLAKLLRSSFKGAKNKAATKYPEVEKIVSDYVLEQRQFEEKQKYDVDAAADPTAKALGKIFATFGQNSSEQRILKRMGYCMGRYIYVMDAVSDYKSDLKQESYNPFKDKTKEEMLLAAQEAINFSAAEAQKAFELLNIYKFKDILGNIIYLGPYETAKEVFEKVKKEKRK